MNGALYDLLTSRFERRHGSALRARQLRHARGRVLEIGAGTGWNLPHYPEAVAELVLSEPDERMLRRARSRGGARVTFVRGHAERLPFPDASFDTVVSTLVLCTVRDQAAALSEIRRVLVPGGLLLFAEHVRAADPRRARRQDRLARPWRLVAGGCHPNRATGAALEAAGFVVAIDEQGDLPMAPSLVKPYIVGRAIAPER